MADQLDKEPAEQKHAPRVTIGLPVYNGENFLSQAIDSILAQTYSDFELIISDNASTDLTQAICRRYADQDKRIRYYRHDHNRGAAPNYNFTFEKAQGEFFKWAAHDDVLEPRFLEEVVEAMDNHPDVTLAYSKTRKINEHNEILGTYDASEDRLRIDDPNPHTRFGDLICIPHNCVAIFGLMRTVQLARTNLHAAYQGADRALLAEMALIGPIYRVPDYLFDRRDHPQAYTANKKSGNRIAWWDSGQADKITFPNWKRLWEYVRAIQRVKPPFPERIASYLQLGRWLVGPHWYRQRWLRLLGDLFLGSWRLVRRAIVGGRASHDNV